MEAGKTLGDFIVMVGISSQDEPIACVVCMRNEMWKSAPILWGNQGTERIEVYELSITGKPFRTIVMGETEE